MSDKPETIRAAVVIRPTVEAAELEDINAVFDRMERGQIDGRVVIDYR